MTDHPQQTGREELLNRLNLVLVRPAFAGNVGAVARVMTNFGVRRGFLVAPRCDTGSVEARQFATGPSAITLATMQTVRTLKEMMTDEISVVALTRRTGQLRKPTLTVQGIVDRLQLGRVAVVFGPEESGLTDEEIRQCSDIITLPVSEAMPSLNLSHAVAIVLGRVFEECATRSPAQSVDSATATEFLALMNHLKSKLESLEASGEMQNGARLTRILSQALARAQLNATEVTAWHALFSVIR